MREESQKQTDTMIRSTPDAVPGSVPPLETVRVEARRRLARTFRPGELVWLLDERYEPVMPAWDMNILRQGTNGRWMHQRYRFDAQSDVLHFMGEDALSDVAFRETRRTGALFPLAT